MRSIWLALSLLLALPTVAQAQSGNPLHDQLSSMSETTRRAEVLRVLTSGGALCPALVTTYFAGFDQARTAYWDLRCAAGGQFRMALPAQRFARLSLAVCGALGGGVASGPCFQPVGEAEQPVAAAAGSGLGVQLAGGQPAAPADGRYGAIYATDAPLAAFGFGNGSTDRLAVNTAAVRVCQAMAGRVPCKFQGEIVNRCGALVQGVTRHPNAVAMTGDLSTMVLARNFPGLGTTVQEAEAEAMRACRALQGVTCRVAASGC